MYAGQQESLQINLIKNTYDYKNKNPGEMFRLDFCVFDKKTVKDLFAG